MKYEVIKWENKGAMLLRGADFCLFVKGGKIDNNNIFKNISIMEATVSGKKGLMVYAKKDILEIIGEHINTFSNNLYETLAYIKNSLTMKVIDILKFRGDLAEAIFILMTGGSKIFEGSSADVFLNNAMIEVKSFSPQKKTIHISMQQLNENTNKFAIELLLDNKGKNIIEIAKLINGNYEFTKYLNNLYKNSIFANIKYKLSKPIDITSQLPKISLNKQIISAVFEVIIDNK